jgi:hypothetical protein
MASVLLPLPPFCVAKTIVCMVPLVVEPHRRRERRAIVCRETCGLDHRTTHRMSESAMPNHGRTWGVGAIRMNTYRSPTDAE